MTELNLDSGTTPVVVIRASDDLSVIGWERAQVRVSGEEDSVALEARGGVLYVRGDSDCTVFVPRDAQAQVERAKGDVRIEGVAHATVRLVGGDLTARQVAGLQVVQVGGDLVAKSSVLLPAETPTLVGGDAIVKVSTDALEPLELAAGGDVRCDLGERADATVRVVSSRGAREMQFGAGGPRISLTAGGSVIVVGMHGEVEGDAARTGFDVDSALARLETLFSSARLNDMVDGLDVGGLDDQLRLKIGRKINRVRERIARQTQRSAARARRAARDVPTGPRVIFPWGTASGGNDAPTSRPAPASEPVGNEERAMILRLVEQKKITVEQAEQLLKAMEV